MQAATSGELLDAYVVSLCRRKCCHSQGGRAFLVEGAARLRLCGLFAKEFADSAYGLRIEIAHDGHALADRGRGMIQPNQ